MAPVTFAPAGAVTPSAEFLFKAKFSTGSWDIVGSRTLFYKCAGAKLFLHDCMFTQQRFKSAHVFAVHLRSFGSLASHRVSSEDSDQTARVHVQSCRKCCCSTQILSVAAMILRKKTLLMLCLVVLVFSLFYCDRL